MKEGNMPEIPTSLARRADDRASEIFRNASNFGRTFKECLGTVYLVGLMAGAEVAKTETEKATLAETLHPPKT